MKNAMNLVLMSTCIVLTLAVSAVVACSETKQQAKPLKFTYVTKEGLPNCRSTVESERREKKFFNKELSEIQVFYCDGDQIKLKRFFRKDK